jgi:hypothetical protein
MSLHRSPRRPFGTALPCKLRQINRVNQLAHSSEVSSVRSTDQPGKLAELGLVLLLPERFACLERVPLKKIRKLAIQLLDCSIADRSLQPNHHLGSDPPIRMEVFVKL